MYCHKKITWMPLHVFGAFTWAWKRITMQNVAIFCSKSRLLKGFIGLTSSGIQSSMEDQRFKCTSSISFIFLLMQYIYVDCNFTWLESVSGVSSSPGGSSSQKSGRYVFHSFEIVEGFATSSFFLHTLNITYRTEAYIKSATDWEG